MNWNLETSMADNRLIIRKVLLEAVKRLNKEEGMTLRDIVAEMLIVSSIVVSDENCEITESNDYSEEYEEGTDINQDYEATDNQDSYLLGHKDRESGHISETEIYKNCDKLRSEMYRNMRLNHHQDAVKSAMALLNMMPEYSETSILYHCEAGNPSYESRFLINFIMKAYVVLTDRDKMNAVVMLAKKLHSIFGDKEIDIEVIEQDFNRHNNDICIMEKIYDFLKLHPKYLQKNIYKELSLEGKKCAYMFEYAEKLGKISRMRHRDSWLLTYNS